PMPAACGLDETWLDAPELPGLFDRVWNAPTDELRTKEWEKLQEWFRSAGDKGDRDVNAQLLRMRLGSLAAQMMVKKGGRLSPEDKTPITPQERERALAVLHLLASRSDDLSAEPHFLYLLCQDLSKEPAPPKS